MALRPGKTYTNAVPFSIHLKCEVNEAWGRTMTTSVVREYPYFAHCVMVPSFPLTTTVVSGEYQIGNRPWTNLNLNIVNIQKGDDLILDFDVE